MENCNNLTAADVTPGGAILDEAGNLIKGSAKKIRDRAKAKKAQAIADAGNYLSLTPYQKSLIPIPDYILAKTAGGGVTEKEIKELPEDGTAIKKYIPWILGGIVLIAVIYFIVK